MPLIGSACLYSLADDSKCYLINQVIKSQLTSSAPRRDPRVEICRHSGAFAEYDVPVEHTISVLCNYPVMLYGTDKISMRRQSLFNYSVRFILNGMLRASNTQRLNRVSSCHNKHFVPICQEKNIILDASRMYPVLFYFLFRNIIKRKRIFKQFNILKKKI